MGPPWRVADDLWERIEPLLPVRERRRRFPGRLPLDDRKCLQGILFVLHTGIQWEWLPQELGFGSGMTCGSGLGTVRWVVERTNAWIHGFRRLRIRWDIRDDIHEAFRGRDRRAGSPCARSEAS
jgi:transposase